MKLSNWMPRCFKRQGYVEDLVMILFVISTAGMVSLIPLVFAAEIANSAADNPALWGDAGWSELGKKD